MRRLRGIFAEYDDLRVSPHERVYIIATHKLEDTPIDKFNLHFLLIFGVDKLPREMVEKAEAVIIDSVPYHLFSLSICWKDIERGTHFLRK